MQIILTQNVPNLGALGDQVHVKDGYARNFLLPRGLAIAAGSKNARHIEHQRKRLEKLRLEAISNAKGEADKVKALQIVVKAKAGPGGKLFGSVNSRDLQAAFAAQGVALDRKAFVLHAPAKNLGSFGATVRLHTDVKVDITFKVEASEIVARDPNAPVEGAPAEAAAAAAAEGAPAAEGTAVAGASGTGVASTDAAAPAQDAPSPDAQLPDATLPDATAPAKS
jgi:large subunit ribosomal protein L9